MRHTLLKVLRYLSLPVFSAAILLMLFSRTDSTGMRFNALAQGTPNCNFTYSFQTPTTSPAVQNGPTLQGGPQGCVAFRMVYYIQPGTGTVSALSVELDGAATSGGSYTALTPAVGGGSGSGSTTNPVTTFPQGQGVMCCDFYPFLKITVNTITVASGAPTLIVKVLGYAGTSAAAGTGGGGGGGGTIAKTTNTLKGDGAGNAVSVTGTATNCVLVNGSSTACGVSGLTLVEEHTAANSASLPFTTCISSTYDNYQIQLVGMIPATGGVSLYLQMSTNGGASYDTGANYSWATFTIVSTGASGGDGSAADVGILLGSREMVSTSTLSLSGTFTLAAPGSASLFKQGYGEFTDLDTRNGSGPPTLGGDRNTGMYNSATAVNAFRLIESTGNITSGTARCYGLAK